MEPITTAWMMSTLLSGWLGNRGDFWLCKGTNHLYNRIKRNVNEPANHHIQRAIRKSYLKATLMAVKHIEIQRKWYKISDDRWTNIRGVKKYVQNQIDVTSDAKLEIQSSSADQSHREILFPKDGASNDRMEELIYNLKLSIIEELERGKRKVELALKNCIMDGWEESGTLMDFYKLTCAFFTQELKENSKLSTYIQTEYLDTIQSEIGVIQLSMSELSTTLELFYEQYKDVLPIIQKIYTSVVELENQLIGLPEKTAALVLRKIQENPISPRQITVSDEYQKYIGDIQSLNLDIQSINDQIAGIRKALPTVDKNIRPALQQNIKNLESQILHKSDEKNRLEQLLDIFVQNVILIAQNFKNVQTSQMGESDRLTRAKLLFEEGSYSEINAILNEQQIDLEINEINVKRKLLANELMIKAEVIIMTKPNNWFNEADRLYSKSLEIIENYETTFNYAFFLAEHQRIREAKETYKKCLKYTNNKIQKSIILNNIGILYQDNKEFEKALQSYQEALEIRRELAKINPEIYLFDVGVTLNNLGALQRENKNFVNAKKLLQEALEIRNKLAEINPRIHLSTVGQTLNNLGRLLSDINELEEAQKSYQEALEIYQNLASLNPTKYLHEISTIFDNMGNLQMSKEEFIDASRSYLNALKIREKLAKRNPEAYLPKVVITLFNLAELQKNQSEFELAESTYIKAYEIRRKLANKSSRKDDIDLANTCLKISLFYQRFLIKKEKSIKFALKALEIYSKYWINIPHAKEFGKIAKDILDYWKIVDKKR